MRCDPCLLWVPGQLIKCRKIGEKKNQGVCGILRGADNMLQNGGGYRELPLHIFLFFSFFFIINSSNRNTVGLYHFFFLRTG